MASADKALSEAFADDFEKAETLSLPITLIILVAAFGDAGHVFPAIALGKALAERGHLVVIAGLTLPNEASEGLHRAMGFEPVGTYRRIGYKLGAWHDVLWLQRRLAPGSEPPAELS